MTTPAYDTSTPKFGPASLLTGTGAISTGLVGVTTSTTYTIEAWGRHPASPSGVEVIAGQVSAFWLGINASGNAVANIGNSGAVTLTSTATLKDGNWHHVRLVVAATTATLSVDGVVAVAATTVSATTSGNPFQVAQYSTGNYWSGETDEVALFNAALPTTYTPPTSPYIGTEANMVDLYHLDSNGNDSVGATATTIAPNNSGIYYSPANWLVGSTQAKTINGGAYFKTVFTGSNVTLNFTLGSSSPYPYIYAFVDGQQVFNGVISTGIALTIPSVSTAWPAHLLEVKVQGVSGNIDRWNTQVAALVFTGLTIGPGYTVTLPNIAAKTIWVYGDSITEGCWIYSHPSSPANDVQYYDGTQGWAYALGKLLGAEVGVIGFSRQGYAETGVGDVPAFPSTYNYLWSGQGRSFSAAPDLILINQGTNDTSGNGVTDAQTISGAEATLAGLIAATPSTTKIVVMRPFNGQDWADIQTAVTNLNNPRILLMDTTGFLNSAYTSDGLHPLGVADQGTIGPLVGNAARSALYPGRSYTFY